MRAHSFFLFIFFSVLLHYSNAAHAVNAKRDVLRIASFPFPPLLHTSIDGSFSGTMGETVKFLCEKANIDCRFQVVPLKRAYEYLKTGKVDALITINVNQFQKCCIPSKWFSPWSAGFFSRTNKIDPPKSPTDVLGQKLIIVNGMRSPYSFMPDLDIWEKNKQVILFRAKDINTSVRMFHKGRADLLWGSDDFNWYFEKNEMSSHHSFTPFTTKPVVIWVRKEHQKTLDKLNHTFLQLKEDQTLNNKHLLNDELMQMRYIDAPFTLKR